MKKKLIFGFFLVSFVTNAQPVLFENNNSALLLMNPSFAGTSGGTRLQTNAFAANVTQSFRSVKMNTSVDHFFESANAGIGCSISMQNFKFLAQTDVTLNWAQHIQLSHKRVKLIPSVIFGMRRIAIDPALFSSSSQPAPQPKLVRTNALIGASVLLEIYERLYVGVVVRDIDLLTDQNANSSLFKIPVSRSFHISYNLQLSKSDLLQAVFRYTNSLSFGTTQIGANYLHKCVLIGAGINAYDASYLQLGFKQSRLTASMQAVVVHSRLAGNHKPSFGVNIAATFNEPRVAPAWKSIETW